MAIHRCAFVCGPARKPPANGPIPYGFLWRSSCGGTRMSFCFGCVFCRGACARPVHAILLVALDPAATARALGYCATGFRLDHLPRKKRKMLEDVVLYPTVRWHWPISDRQDSFNLKVDERGEPLFQVRLHNPKLGPRLGRGSGIGFVFVLPDSSEGAMQAQLQFAKRLVGLPDDSEAVVRSKKARRY